MIKKIKVVSDENLNLEDSEIKDVAIDLSKEDGFNGERVEADPDFTLKFIAEDTYLNSTDKYFKPEKTYYIKNGNERRTTATPGLLNLYVFNGLNYQPVTSVKKPFEDREYFYDEEGLREATPENLNLKELSPSMPDKRYVIYYKNDNKPFCTIQYDVKDSWETAKKVYEYCLNNKADIEATYNEEGNKGLKELVEPLLKGYGKEVVKKKKQIAKENSINRSNILRSQQYNHPKYKEFVFDYFMENVGKTPEQFIKDTSNSRTLSKEDQFLMEIIAGRRVVCRNNKYYATSVKESSDFLIQKEGTRKEGTVNEYEIGPFDTLDALLDEIVKNNQIAVSLQRNIKEKDSFEYIRYEMKDNKQHIIGYYKTFQDAQDAEYNKKLVKLLPGVYFNEESNKYLAIPENEKIDENSSAYKIVRLGEFETEAEARKAVMTFNRLPDIDSFFQSNFYLEHLDECQEARDYYYKENHKDDLGKKYFIQKVKGGKYAIIYIDPETGKRKWFASGTGLNSFETEADANFVVSQAQNSDDYFKFFEKRDKDIRNTFGENLETLKTLRNTGTRETRQSKEEALKALASVSSSDLTIEEEIAILQEGLTEGNSLLRSGGTKILKGVVEYLRKKFGINKDDLNWDNTIGLQSEIIEDFIDYAINDIPESVVNKINEIVADDGLSDWEKIDGVLSEVCSYYGIDYSVFAQATTRNDKKRYYKQLI